MYFELRVFFPDREANRHNAYSRGSKKVYQFLEDFEQAYGRFRKKRGYYEGMEREYLLRSDKVNFKELFQMVKPFEKKLTMAMQMEQIYEKVDFETADAYLFYFPRNCYFYDDEDEDDDEDEETFNSLRSLCPRCSTRGIREPIYIKPNSRLRNLFGEEFAGASDELGYGVNILSDPLRDYLVQQGIAEKYFRPVYSRRGDQWTYCFWPDERKIPHLSLIDNVDTVIGKCPTCGRQVFLGTAKTKSESLWNRLRIPLKFGSYPIPELWKLKREVGEALPPLSLTEDYFEDRQLLVMNRELFDLIAEKLPRVKKRSVPIYFADFDTEVRKSARVYRVHMVYR